MKTMTFKALLLCTTLSAVSTAMDADQSASNEGLHPVGSAVESTPDIQSNDLSDLDALNIRVGDVPNIREQHKNALISALAKISSEDNKRNLCLDAFVKLYNPYFMTENDCRDAINALAKAPTDSEMAYVDRVLWLIGEKGVSKDAVALHLDYLDHLLALTPEQIKSYSVELIPLFAFPRIYDRSVMIPIMALKKVTFISNERLSFKLNGCKYYIQTQYYNVIKNLTEDEFRKIRFVKFVNVEGKDRYHYSLPGRIDFHITFGGRVTP